MLSGDNALDRCGELIACARRLGADGADAVYVGSHSESVQVRLGGLEDVDRSESEHFGLRVFIGMRQATIGSSAVDAGRLEELASRAIAMARAAPEDENAALAPRSLLMRQAPPDLDLVSDLPGPDTLREAALASEDAARAVAGVTNSEGAAAGTGHSVIALATSDGFGANYAQSQHSLSAAVVAGEGSGMERGAEWRVARHRGDLPDAAWIGAKAARRAVERLGPASVRSGAMPVVFDPLAGRSLLGHFVAAISGPSIARGGSFLLEREGERVFDSSVTIVDDPLVMRGLGSRPFDGEGLETRATTLIGKGVLTGWMLDSASARKLGRQPTGHAVRLGGAPPSVSSSNLTLLAGERSVAELIADIAEGVLLTELIGPGVNIVSGDYSRGAAGFLIRDGQIAGPVSGITVAGNMADMFANMHPANDLEIIYSTNVPTLRVDGMTVAGS